MKFKFLKLVKKKKELKKMSVILKAKSREGYAFKVLIELLQNNIKNACFEVDKKGIRLKMMDHHKTILINLELDAENFTPYIFNPPEGEKIYLGINLNHLHKMLKLLKKKDNIELFILSNQPNELGINVVPKESSNRLTTSTIKIINMPNIDICLPEGYDETPVNLPSTEFQKMCKGLSQISHQVHISTKKFLVRFSSDAGGVMKRFTEFGENDETDNKQNNDSEYTEYSDDFDTEQLIRISKLSGLSTNMKIYSKIDNPLLFTSSIGSLGKISIYLKSKAMREVESKVMESEEND